MTEKVEVTPVAPGRVEVGEPDCLLVNADGSRSFAHSSTVGIDDTWVALPADYALYEPGDWVWDGEALVENVDAARLRFWEQRKALRDARIDGGCDTPHGRVDTDKASRDAIDGICQRAAELFPVLFTLADNTSPPRTLAEMLEIKEAVDIHVQAERDAASAVRDALNDPAKTTLAALYAVPRD